MRTGAKMKTEKLERETTGSVGEDLIVVLAKGMLLGLGISYLCAHNENSTHVALDFG